jgi:uncharacterized protein
MKPFVVAALFVGGLVAGAAHAQSMPVMELTAGFHRIEAEVAANNPARMQGLMYRKAMPQQHGMVFAFPMDAQHCMWMKNTFLPLSVAFIDASGRIVNIEEMKPQTEDNHCAAKPARFALEMNAGWFAQVGLKPGDAINGIDRLSPAQ